MEFCCRQAPPRVHWVRPQFSGMPVRHPVHSEFPSHLSGYISFQESSGKVEQIFWRPTSLTGRLVWCFDLRGGNLSYFFVLPNASLILSSPTVYLKHCFNTTCLEALSLTINFKAKISGIRGGNWFLNGPEIQSQEFTWFPNDRIPLLLSHS